MACSMARALVAGPRSPLTTPNPDPNPHPDPNPTPGAACRVRASAVRCAGSPSRRLSVTLSSSREGRRRPAPAERESAPTVDVLCETE